MATFREEYEGMPDREILIDMAARVRTLEFNEHKRPPCPSSLCAAHTTDINDVNARLTDIEEWKKNIREARRTWVDYFVNGVIAMGAAFAGILVGKGG